MKVQLFTKSNQIITPHFVIIHFVILFYWNEITLTNLKIRGFILRRSKKKKE